MGVSLFYFIALVPIAIGALLWILDKEIVWWEWLVGSLAAILMAAIFHGLSIWGMTDDIETWSGYITQATHFPRWIEEYQEEHTQYHTDSKGHTYTTTYYTTEHRTHPEYWEAYTPYDDHQISSEFFNEICRNFANLVTEDGHKSGFDGGDPNVYVSRNKTGFIYPTTILRHWSNRTKVAPSVFSFAHVLTNIAVYPWPQNPDWRISQRLMGAAPALFDQLEFDRMNSRLGPSKKVNLIFVGFGDKDSSYGQWQEAKWLGGKKNDLVVAFGGMTKNRPATWVHVFGWSESFLAKRNIETLFMTYPASPQLMQLVENEVKTRYTIKDWSKFDYLTVEPPTWSYVVYFVVLIVTQGGLYLFFHAEQLGEASPFYNSAYSRRRRGY